MLLNTIQKFLLCGLVLAAMAGCSYVEDVTDSVTDTMSDAMTGAVDVVDFWSGDESPANATVQAPDERNLPEASSEIAQPLPLPEYPEAAQQAESAGAASAEDANPTVQSSRGMALARKYWYYPDDRVYFDPVRSVYFYWNKGEWAQSASLPENMLKLLGSPVELTVDSNEPYEHNRQHMNDYPPGQVRVRPPAAGSW